MGVVGLPWKRRHGVVECSRACSRTGVGGTRLGLEMENVKDEVQAVG